MKVNGMTLLVRWISANLKDSPLKLAFTYVVNIKIGECKLGHYDGNIIQTIKGLLYQE